MLAIIGAMAEEVDLLHAELVGVRTETHAGISVARGRFQGVELVLARCGIGKVNAAICAQMLIDLYKPRALVFSGVAGGLLPNMRIGDIIIASHVVQYDMDLTAFGRRHGELPGRDRMLESDPALVQAAADAFDAAFEGVENGPNLMLGTVASGDRFVQDKETLRWLQREFAALATEMEGAAVGHTCHLNEIPFVVIRGLSDTAGASATSDFAANLSTVCRNCFEILEKLIPALGNVAAPLVEQAPAEVGLEVS